MNFANVTNWKIPEGDVLRVTDSLGRVIWEKPTPGPDYTEPFYVENITNSTETLSIAKSDVDAPTLTIYKSEDKTNWTLLGTTSTTALTLTLTPGKKIYLRCRTNYWTSSISQEAHSNRITGISKVGGNIMSLLYGSNFAGNETTFPANNSSIFKDLFYGSYTITSSEKLLLPATTLYDSCYSGMFERCRYLVNSPKLPALTLAEGCYNLMFEECNRLETAPELPATTLYEGCYSNMFYRCSTLTKAPDLPANIVSVRGYYKMFFGCISLNEIKCTATSIISTDALTDWVAGVPASGTFTKAAGITWPTGYSGIPSGWTVVEQ